MLQVEGFEKRVVYNVAKAYVNQIARGELYPDLNDVVGITIIGFFGHVLACGLRARGCALHALQMAKLGRDRFGK
ncbi:MAG: hypothetical protein R3F14_12515 [Polyangiaceae bacterium]